MATKNTSITIFEPLYKEGRRRMKETHCANFSTYLSNLIRKDALENPPPTKDAAKKKPGK